MFVIAFDSRDPGGPMMVGPFSSPESADAWVSAQRLESSVYSVVPVANPKEL